METTEQVIDFLISKGYSKIPYIDMCVIKNIDANINIRVWVKNIIDNNAVEFSIVFEKKQDASLPVFLLKSYLSYNNLEREIDNVEKSLTRMAKAFYEE